MVATSKTSKCNSNTSRPSSIFPLSLTSAIAICTDWPHSVTDEPGLFTHEIQKSYDAHLKQLAPESGNEVNGTVRKRRCVKGISGLDDGLNDDGKERLRNVTILCGSQHAYEADEDRSSEGEQTESVLVFPDYKVCAIRIIMRSFYILMFRYPHIQLVTNIPTGGAQRLVEEHLSPRILDRKGLSSLSSTIQSFVLPYYAVLLICA